MIYYDTLFLRKHTKRLYFIQEYAIAFNEFHKDLDQGFVDSLANFNPLAPQYWRHWKKACEIVDWTQSNKIHPKDFWELAYSIIGDTGESTRSFNTFGLPWLLDAILERRIQDDRIRLAESYTLENYSHGNLYYKLYYKALFDKLKNKYGDSYKNPLTKMITSGKIFLNIINDFKEDLK